MRTSANERHAAVCAVSLAGGVSVGQLGRKKTSTICFCVSGLVLPLEMGCTQHACMLLMQLSTCCWRRAALRKLLGNTGMLHPDRVGKDHAGWLVNDAADMADVTPLLHTSLHCSCLHNAISACHDLFLPLAVLGCRSSSCLRSGGEGQSTQPTGLQE